MTNDQGSGRTETKGVELERAHRDRPGERLLLRRSGAAARRAGVAYAVTRTARARGRLIAREQTTSVSSVPAQAVSWMPEGRAE